MAGGAQGGAQLRDQRAPCSGFTLGGAAIGDELRFACAQPRVAFSVRLRSIVAVDHLELVCNGRVVRSFVTHSALDHGDFSGSIALKDSGWCVVRASTRRGTLSGAGYLCICDHESDLRQCRACASRDRREDARYFAAWIDRMTETTAAYPDWNSAAEKSGVLERLAQAKLAFVKLQ